MSNKKTLLNEGTIRRFMKLANMDGLAESYLDRFEVNEGDKEDKEEEVKEEVKEEGMYAAKEDDEVKEVMKTLANLKIKEGAIKSDGSYESVATTYSNFLKVKSLITKIKEEALKYDFITLDCDLGKIENSSQTISKENKKLYGTSKLTDLVSNIEKDAA